MSRIEVTDLKTGKLYRADTSTLTEITDEFVGYNGSDFSIGLNKGDGFYSYISIPETNHQSNVHPDQALFDSTLLMYEGDILHLRDGCNAILEKLKGNS